MVDVVNKTKMSRSEQWLQDFEAAEKLGQEIMELINERNSMERTGSTTARIQSLIRTKLQSLSKKIKSLKEGLLRETTLFTTHEAERRQNQIDVLISKEKQLNEAFKPSSGNNRDALFNQGFNVERNDAWGNTTHDDGSDDITPGAFQGKQAQIIQEQDKGLDALSKVIQRQKMMGHAIGDEIDYQNELIDDISADVDQTNEKLIRTEKHVKKVHRKSGSCALLVTVVLLFIGIVVVAVVPN